MDPIEDEFSRLQDELYKTVVMLSQTRAAALVEKSNYADNLSNIAHQLKTPITSISLSTQMMKEESTKVHVRKIKKQVDRLSYLEESLLLLARIDAGTLRLKLAVTDIFTLLMMAVDNLQELFTQARVTVEIPEIVGVEAYIDMEWTMEAMMNLLKNCMEYSESGGQIYCSYEKNPLYVQIRIWDEGPGFQENDIPHIFEKFYRGSSQMSQGIGIGLPLAKSIIELQNGIIRAFNLTDKGACFEVRFYSH